jgi:hypothetical protein
MSTPLKTAVLKYLRAGNHANGTHKTYRTTLRKWSEWGGDVPIEELTRLEELDIATSFQNVPMGYNPEKNSRTSNVGRSA